jgi:hypothetical protein
VAAATLAAAGCGGGGSGSAELPPATSVPAAAATPIAVSAVSPGDAVTAGPRTPKAVKAALQGSHVVVIAFLMDGAADDQAVSDALAQVRVDRSSRNVDFFVYRLGKGSFGDLADLLGVTGTPSVAVIGRDRKLTNLWTGLTDADVLRQSIQDAGDTAAASPGAAARDAAKDTPAPKDSTGANGSADGIAVAKAVNAAYAGVPGVRLAGTGKIDASLGTGPLRLDFGLAKGITTGATGTFTGKGVSFRIRVVGSTGYVRPAGSACWTTFPAADTVGTPVIEMRGRFSAPERSGGQIHLSVAVTRKGATTTDTYTIDAASSRVLRSTQSVGTVTWTDLDAAPKVVAPTAICPPAKGATATP